MEDTPFSVGGARVRRDCTRESGEVGSAGIWSAVCFNLVRHHFQRDFGSCSNFLQWLNSSPAHRAFFDGVFLDYTGCSVNGGVAEAEPEGVPNGAPEAEGVAPSAGGDSGAAVQ